MNEIPPERDIHDTFRECLSQAEAAFGARSSGWQYAVRLRNHPSLPETVVTSIDMVTVWLTKERSRVGYVLEAGHEVVHCLNPGPPDSTYLEEAVATAFSLRLVFSRFGQPRLDRITLTKDYILALGMAATIDRDVVELGRRLRGHAGSLRKVRPEAVRELYPHAPYSTVQQILEMFPRQGQSKSTP